MPPVVGVIGSAVFGVVFAVVPVLILASIVFGSSSGEFAAVLLPILMAVAFAGFGLFSLRGIPRRWRLATGDRDLLTVGSDGIRLRDGRTLQWNQVELVESDGSRLVIRPVGAPPEDVITLDFDLFEADDDDILDAIARYRVVEET